MLQKIYAFAHAIVAAAALFMAFSVFVIRTDHWQGLQVCLLTMFLSGAVSYGFFAKKRLAAAVPALPLFLAALIWVCVCFYGYIYNSEYSGETATVLLSGGLLACAFELSTFFIAVKVIEEEK